MPLLGTNITVWLLYSRWQAAGFCQGLTEPTSLVRQSFVVRWMRCLCYILPNYAPTRCLSFEFSPDQNLGQLSSNGVSPSLQANSEWDQGDPSPLSPIPYSTLPHLPGRLVWQWFYRLVLVTLSSHSRLRCGWSPTTYFSLVGRILGWHFHKSHCSDLKNALLLIRLDCPPVPLIVRFPAGARVLFSFPKHPNRIWFPPTCLFSAYRRLFSEV